MANAMCLITTEVCRGLKQRMSTIRLLARQAMFDAHKESDVNTPGSLTKNQPFLKTHYSTSGATQEQNKADTRLAWQLLESLNRCHFPTVERMERGNASLGDYFSS